MPACGEAALRRLQGLAAVARDVDREVEVVIDQRLSGDPPAKRGSTLVGCEATNRRCSLCAIVARFTTGLHRALGFGSPEKARRGLNLNAAPSDAVEIARMDDAALQARSQLALD